MLHAVQRPPFASNRIVADAGVCNGAARIAGTRVKVAFVAWQHERLGLSPDDIVAHCPALTLADVHAALAHYFDHRDDIDRDWQADLDYAEKLRPAGPSLSERLKSRVRDAAAAS